MNLGDAFLKIKKGIFKNEENFEKIRVIIEKSIGIKLKKNEIILLKDSIKIKSHPAIKHQIKLKKKEILEKLSKEKIFKIDIF